MGYIFLLFKRDALFEIGLINRLIFTFLSFLLNNSTNKKHLLKVH